MKRYHKKFRIKRPDHVYIGSANVSIKPISGKYSWTSHPSRESAVSEAISSVNSRKNGYHTRRLYRINVFLKLSALEKAGIDLFYTA